MEKNRNKILFIFFLGNGSTSDFENSNWWVPVNLYEYWGMAVDFSNAMI